MSDKFQAAGAEPGKAYTTAEVAAMLEIGEVEARTMLTAAGTPRAPGGGWVVVPAADPAPAAKPEPVKAAKPKKAAEPAVEEPEVVVSLVDRLEAARRKMDPVAYVKHKRELAAAAPLPVATTDRMVSLDQVQTITEAVFDDLISAAVGGIDGGIAALRKRMAPTRLYECAWPIDEVVTKIPVGVWKWSMDELVKARANVYLQEWPGRWVLINYERVPTDSETLSGYEAVTHYAVDPKGAKPEDVAASVSVAHKRTQPKFGYILEFAESTGEPRPVYDVNGNPRRRGDDGSDIERLAKAIVGSKREE